LKAHTKEIEWDALPKAFQDDAIISMALGV
jgi:hypothetical protein